MCLIVLGWQPGPAPSLVVAANRDEFHRRPTAALAFWPDAPQVLAGRDLQSGGTWMGITRDGRFAALTNFRDPSRQRPDAPSRGQLLARFLTGTAGAAAQARTIAAEATDYNGFNLLLCDGNALFWVGHGAGEAVQCVELAPGVHAVSNHRPGTPWPKLQRARQGFDSARKHGEAGARREALFAMLSDRTQADDDDLPDTGVGLEWERRLSPVFIAGPDYGTRSSTVLEQAGGHVRVEERCFGPDGVPAGRTVLTL